MSIKTYDPAQVRLTTSGSPTDGTLTHTFVSVKSAEPLQAYRVHEGSEQHIVIAHDPEQARGIAFGHRFADPDEWGDGHTMDVDLIPPHPAGAAWPDGIPPIHMVIRCDDPAWPSRPLSKVLSEATGPEYVGSTLV